MRSEVRRILENEVFTAFESGQILGVSAQAFRHQAEMSGVDTVTVGNCTMIDAQDLLKVRIPRRVQPNLEA